MSKCYLYLRTSSDDRGVKLGIDVQRQGCMEYITRSGMKLAREFSDDGITGTRDQVRVNAFRIMVSSRTQTFHRHPIMGR